MKKPWPPVRSARTFAKAFGLIRIKDKKITLTTLSRRLLRYTKNKRVDFIITHIRLQDKEPFLTLRQQLSKAKGSISFTRLGEILQLKFDPASRWTTDAKNEYGGIYARWLEYLRIGKITNHGIEYVGGIVKGLDVSALTELEFLLERTLYDWMTEEFHTPHNLLDEPLGYLQKVDQALDDNERGELFQKFAYSAFRRFGFSPRSRAGNRERGTKLTFDRTKGGGDVAVFCHFPISGEDKVYTGFALACEAKSSKSPIGSKAVGQARNLAAKIKEAFPDYLVLPIVLSRSQYGYDQSGKDLAPPEVIHLSHDILLRMLNIQKKRLENASNLLTPTQFMVVLDSLIKDQVIEPIVKQFEERILKLGATEN